MERKKRLNTGLLTVCIVLPAASVGLGAALLQAKGTLEETGLELAAARAELAACQTQLEETGEVLSQIRSELERSETEAECIRGWDSPIDRYFFSEKRGGFSGITVEMNAEAWFYYEACRRELGHAVEWIQSDCGGCEE